MNEDKRNKEQKTQTVSHKNVMGDQSWSPYRIRSVLMAFFCHLNNGIFFFFFGNVNYDPGTGMLAILIWFTGR